MDKRTKNVIGGLKFCKDSVGYCDTGCPMYARCVGNEEDLFYVAANELEHTARALDVMTEVMEGVEKRYIYFILESKELRHPLPKEGKIAFIVRDERRYVPAIDRMALGLAIYNRELTGEEMRKSCMISRPRD